MTWKFWDIERRTCIFTQDGHESEVYCVAFHLDGSLVGSGGLDGYGRIWDLRAGQCVLNLQGHFKQVLAMDFAPSGYHVVTGSQDNSLKIWDLRQAKCIYTVPAHTSLVSHVKYYVHSPSCWVTPNDSLEVDGYLDVYQHENESPFSMTYERGHPITSGMYLVSSGFDGKINVWGEGDYKLIQSFQGHEGKVMAMDISSDSQLIASAGYDRTFKLWASHQVQI
ncbi:hypothetical protein HMI54_006592 [Coelomomyces lativittatus]|nr:hypothetical protein HMI55_005399 [Coelomomyces lativittatus]KAJ1517210.1 hypothetical protein HMI54_006592 [Coelomomyces lativittatus]